MATAADLLADLNDRIDDAANSQVPEVTKIRYLNQGIRAMWPRIYRTVSDTTLEIATDTYEYTIPSAVGDHALITRIDVESGDATGRYHRLEECEVLPVQTGKTLVLDRIPSAVGSRIRIISAKRLTEFVTSATTYDGPPGTEEIPVWYALGLVISRGHENRMDYTRLVTLDGQNGVGPNEIMNSAQFCFAQFELLLERAALPLPSEGG